MTTAGRLSLHLNPLEKGYLFGAHKSVEVGHRRVLAHLEPVPLLDLDLTLDEGTCAAPGMPLVEAGAEMLSEMATFADAGVAKKYEELVKRKS